MKRAVPIIIDGEEREETPEKIIDILTYKCYEYNRTISPHVTVEEWGRIFSNVRELEREYKRRNNKL